MKKNTCIVIPNWNGLPFVLDCLESLKAQTLAHDVVVVDNGSIDDSIQTIESRFPDVTIIALPKNTGFTGGVNEGMQYALNHNYDYIGLLNNDATVKSNWLENLVRTLEKDKSIGIATCKLLHTDKRHFDSTGDFYSTRGIAFPRDRNHLDKGQRDVLEEVFSASGGASLYRTTMLKQIGLMDDYFFAYFEDVDISFRAQLAGWKIVYQPAAVAYHAISATSSRVASFGRYHSLKNMPVVFLKNMPLILLIKYSPLFLYQNIRQVGASLLRGQVIVHMRASLRFLAHIPRLIIDRHRTQKSRTVSIKELDKKLYHAKPPLIPTR